jgi:hypothetical protein
MFAIKTEVIEPQAEVFAFGNQKTMYGGKEIAKGDVIFVFASENEGGAGLVASGIVISAEALPRKRGIARQTPRASASPSGAPRSRSAALGEASSNSSPTGTTVDPRPSSTSSSIAKQRTRLWASQMKRPYSSADSSRGAALGMNTSALRSSEATNCAVGTFLR